MDEQVKTLVEKYQCPGCILGSDTNCGKFRQSFETGVGCLEHHSGTMLSNIGKVFLGLPTGFCRIGNCGDMKIYIFTSVEQFQAQWGYDKLNIPVWFYKDGNNYIIRGLSPRNNQPFLHIIANGKPNLMNTIEITDEYLKEID